jgi:hypothetical protein
MQEDTAHIDRVSSADTARIPLTRSAKRPPKAQEMRSPRSRARVTNRTKLLDGVDGRRATARRFRDLVVVCAREHGGTDALSPADFNLVKQAAAVMLRAEQLQGAICRGEAVLTDELVRLSGEARRMLLTVARRRRLQQRKDAPPTLSEHLASTAFKNEPSDGAT